MLGRLVILDVTPQVSCGRWPARAVVGEVLPVEATIFREGHDLIAAAVLLRAPGGDKGGGRARRYPMTDVGGDRWRAEVPIGGEGRWHFSIEAWADPFATWVHDVEIKHGAGQDIAVELEEGARLLERAHSGIPKGVRGNGARTTLSKTVATLRDPTVPPGQRITAATSPRVTAVLADHPVRDLVTVSDRQPLWVDRQRALFSAWYEFFPRSEGAIVSADGQKSGTLRTAAARLPAIAEMGFDVVYLPPIHPIGTSFRKGPNNSLEASPDDVGSPWAIGSDDGGHDAVHRDLGSIEDFDDFVAATRELGMEVALDLALQCSPDHPWVKEHPEWFTARADGSIAYAENPPKRYQDIYPLNFDNDPDGLYAEVLRVVRHWMAHGVRIFRVDNPHTKPFVFWEWLIAEVKKSDPDVLFLSEAFTRPAVMQTLAALGFTQSYTYFTWRNAKWEIEEYFREVSTPPLVDVMRPNFFVNTPDILHAYLQYGGAAAFKIRAVLAALGSPSWGVYSGFELFEGVAVREGSEEYLDSEKFQLRPRDWEAPSLAPYLARLNEIRRSHPALHWLRTLRVHWTDQADVVAFSKRDPATGDSVLAIVNVDPHVWHEATVHLDLDALGFAEGEAFVVEDLITGATYTWHGSANYVRLDPHDEPAHIFAVRRA